MDALSGFDALPCICSDQDLWTREQVRKRKNSDPLWQHAGLILAQLDGLQAGAAHWAKSRQKEVRDNDKRERKIVAEKLNAFFCPKSL